MAKFNKHKRRRRRETLNPTERVNKLWDDYLKWKNTDTELRGLWTNYRRLGNFSDDAIGN